MVRPKWRELESITRLRVENNSKFVGGKNESRRQIEEQVLLPYSMVKTGNERWDYEIRVPFDNDKELDNLVDEIICEAGYIAYMRNGFVEMDIVDSKTERSWYKSVHFRLTGLSKSIKLHHREMDGGEYTK